MSNTNMIEASGDENNEDSSDDEDDYFEMERKMRRE